MSSVFCSHATEDRPFVESELIPQLAGAGYAPWYCKDDVRPAEVWRESIRAALQNSEWFLAVLSPHALASLWVGWEVQWAMENRVGRVVTILTRDCSPGDLHIGLTTIQTVDYRLVTDGGRRALLEAFEIARRPESIYLSLELLRWRHEQEGWVRTSQLGGLPLESGDRIRIALRSSRPAFLFLALIDGCGRTMPCHPWAPGGWALASCAPSLRVELPSDDPDEGWVVENPGDALTLAVLGGEGLASSGMDWEALFDDLPKTQELPNATRANSFEWRKAASPLAGTRGTFQFVPTRVRARPLPIHQELRDRFQPYAEVVVAHTFPCRK
jgi:hypothetical protein